MSTVEESIDVNVPVSTAYNQWTQFEEFPRFMEGVEEIRQIDDTHVHWKTKIAGIEREFDTEITEQHPDHRVAWRATEGTQHAGVGALGGAQRIGGQGRLEVGQGVHGDLAEEHRSADVGDRGAQVQAGAFEQPRREPEPDGGVVVAAGDHHPRR